MKTACCIVLAAIVALVSAECDLTFRFGDKCDSNFCDKLNSSFSLCKGDSNNEAEKDDNPESPESLDHPESDAAGKQAHHEKCEKMRQCVEGEIKKNDDAQAQYDKVNSFCELTTSEGTNKDPAKNPKKNHDICVMGSIINCCDFQFGHGRGGKRGKHGPNGGKDGSNAGAFIAFDKAYMSMFN